jgi:hypothetical protein
VPNGKRDSDAIATELIKINATIAFEIGIVERTQRGMEEVTRLKGYKVKT